MTGYRITIDCYAYKRHAAEGPGMEQGTEYAVAVGDTHDAGPVYRCATIGEVLDRVKVLAEGMEGEKGQA